VQSSNVSCDRVVLSQDDKVVDLAVGWDSRGISLVSLRTEKGVIAIFGEETVAKESYKIPSEVHLVGIFGKYTSQGTIA